jgi:C-terminal processing protease CtpA/Prc
VLFFFTGLHTDYHKPSDDAHKINYYGMKIITQYIYNVALALSEKENIPFFKTQLKTEKKVAKYKVSLGIMPDYKDYGDGLHVESVVEGRAGQIAGLKDGDVIIKIGDCEIKEVYSYMECLSKFKEGDNTTLTIKRNQEIKILNVQF